MALGKKRPGAGEGCDETITFTKDYLDGVEILHNDALVITLKIGEYNIERIFVDSGIFIEILHYEAFKKLGLTQDDLKRSTNPMVGFSARAVWPLGK